jgi:1,4-dihydroxy-6-naphthoate synthase
VPGLRTSAYLALKLYEPSAVPVVIAFDKIVDAVRDGAVPAGLLIHEGQLMFPQAGLHRVADLGQWWLEETGMPLPLGGNAVRRALGPDVARRVARAIRDSVSYALEHRDQALIYAMQFARDMEQEVADKFVGMYVNKWTLGYGEKGRRAVREFLKRGAQAGIIPEAGKIDFIGADPA